MLINVAIVDDKLHNRRILADKLAAQPFFNIVLQADNGNDFLEKIRVLPAQNHPGIVLMDIEMPVMDGVAAIATGSSLYPSTKFVVLSIFDDDDKIFRAIKAGACGYILKEESSVVISNMLLNLWESGAGPISPSIAYKILQMLQQRNQLLEPETEENFFNLSDRENEILVLLSKGFDYKEIASRIYISPNTVKKHIINIYQKLHVNNKAQALKIAYTKKLI